MLLSIGKEMGMDQLRCQSQKTKSPNKPVPKSFSWRQSIKEQEYEESRIVENPSGPKVSRDRWGVCMGVEGWVGRPKAHLHIYK